MASSKPYILAKNLRHPTFFKFPLTNLLNLEVAEWRGGD